MSASLAVSADDEAVFVESAARLHFGVLDLRGELGRWFGGMGAAAPAPTLVVSANRSPSLIVEGEEQARAREFARTFLAHHAVESGAHIVVHQALPPHSGLGSGTQLALAVARALAELYDLPSDAAALARGVGRARRSAVGTWTFAGGGLVLEGGRRPDHDDVAPLLARLPFPASWRCVVAIPQSAPGVSGSAEEQAFAQLPSPPERDIERVAHRVLMAILPAVVEGDLATFGAALTEVQEMTGRWFATAQGGTFAAGPSARLVQLLRENGATGVGQSSWGPAVYGIVDGEDAGVRLAAVMRSALGGAGVVAEGPFRQDGARVWRARRAIG